MPFDYYYRLSRRDREIYRESDRIAEFPAEVGARLGGRSWLKPLERIRAGLEAGSRRDTELAARDLIGRLNHELGVLPVRVRIRSVRPSEDWGELHGLYTPPEGRAWGVVEVWMRTAHHRRVVAFRTFVRTLLHEVCHHLDYELFGLEDSFHTEGFFKREARLFRHLGLKVSS